MSIDIKASREICGAATPLQGLTVAADGIYQGAVWVMKFGRFEDQVFYAHARTALPAALDEIERLRAALAQAITNTANIRIENERLREENANLRREWELCEAECADDYETVVDRIMQSGEER